MRHISEHHRLKIYALRSVLPEMGRIFLTNAMEAELNNRHEIDNRNWLLARLKAASDEAKGAAIAVFDDFVNK